MTPLNLVGRCGPFLLSIITVCTGCVKFITAIILKDSPASKNIPQVTRLKGDDLQGVRIAKGDKITDVYLNTRADGHIMHRNSCTNVNGWDTDAYLLAFSRNIIPNRDFSGTQMQSSHLYINCIYKTDVN